MTTPKDTIRKQWAAILDHVAYEVETRGLIIASAEWNGLANETIDKLQALLDKAVAEARRDERNFVIKAVDELFKSGVVYQVEWERLASELEDPLLPENQIKATLESVKTKEEK